MNRFKLWPSYAVAYFMWIVSFLFWLWFMILGRQTLSGILGIYYINDRFDRMNQAQFFDRAFMFGTGLIWVIIMIIVENYFRNGVKKGDLWRRIGRVIGPQVLIIFIADAAKAFLVDPFPLPWVRWVLLVAELALSVGLIWFSYRKVQPVMGIRGTPDSTARLG